MKQFLLPLVLAAVLCGGAVLLSRSQPPPPEIGKLVPFQFEDADGGVFTPGHISGKTSVWTFFFTSCQGPCPALQATVAKLQRDLEDVDGLEFVSLSIDPERDTPARLRDYRDKLGGNSDHWRMLRPIAGTAGLDEFARESFRVGLDLKELIHSNRLLLVDANGTVRGAYDSTSTAGLEQLEADIRSLLR